MDLSLPTLEQQSTETDAKQPSTTHLASKQWIDRMDSQQTLLNHKRMRMYKPKYKLTLWDIREVYDCRIRRVRGNKHELIFSIEIANAPKQKIEVSKNDINGSTVTRGDIFVRFFKSHYGVDNTHQLEHLLLQRLKSKNIELPCEKDEPRHYANIPPLKPQTIKNTKDNNTTHTPPSISHEEEQDDEDDDDVHIISQHSHSYPTNNGASNQQSPQILSITAITPPTSNPTPNKKRSIRSMLLSGKSNGNPFIINTSQNSNNHLSLPALTNETDSPSLTSHNSSTPSHALQPPPAKRQKVNQIQLNLLLKPTMITHQNNGDHTSNKQKQNSHDSHNNVSYNTLYTKTKLKLEEMIKLQRTQDGKSAQLSSMNAWCDSMSRLEHGAFQLLAMYASIQQESEQFTSSIVAEKVQFESLEKENYIRNELQSQLGQNLNTFSKQLNSVDAQIRKLVLQRQQIQQNLNTTKQTMEANKVSMNNYTALKQQYITQMSERVKHIQDTQTFLPVIKKITDRYQDTIHKLRGNLRTFESDWKEWNERHVQHWVKHIENGKFAAMDKYATCQNHIAKAKVTGSDLVGVNDSILRTSFGIEKDCDRKLLLNNIARLNSKPQTSSNHNGTNVLLQAIELLEAQEKTK